MINPSPNQADLLVGQRFDASTIIQWRHPAIRVVRQVRHGFNDHAVRAVADSDNLTFLGAFQHTFQAVHFEAGFRAVAAMAFDTRRIENGLDVRGVGHAGFLGSWRQRGFRIFGGNNGGQGQRGSKGQGGQSN